MTAYINHITLSTGHNRRSPRSEVSDQTLAILYPWLEQALAAGEPIPLPAPTLAHYSAKAVKEAGMLVTVYGPRGPHLAGKPHAGELDPLVTLGLAQRSREAEPLWQMMVDTFGAAPSIKMPSVPWCAIALHPALINHRDALVWLGDLERCIAWAWITRNPALHVVPKKDI